MVRDRPRPTTDTLSLLSVSVLHCIFIKATSVLVLASLSSFLAFERASISIQVIMLR